MAIKKMPLFAVRRMVGAAVALMLLSAASAWGATQISTFGQPGFPAYSINDGVLFAQSFTTGNFSSFNWTLQSVTLGFGNAGSPETLGSFSAAIYGSNTTTFAPSSFVTAMAGSTFPAFSGNYTYTAAGATLSPNTMYWIVMTSTGGSGGSYVGQMDTAASPVFTTAINGWAVDFSHDTALSFNSGASWSTFNYGFNGMFIFSVDATPVPEPATWAAVLGLASFAMAGGMRRQRRIGSN
jgi:hypothetical protein